MDSGSLCNQTLIYLCRYVFLSPGGHCPSLPVHLWRRLHNLLWRWRTTHKCHGLRWQHLYQMCSCPWGSDSSARKALLGSWGGWRDRVPDRRCLWRHREELVSWGQQYLVVYETHPESIQVAVSTSQGSFISFTAEHPVMSCQYSLHIISTPK